MNRSTFVVALGLLAFVAASPAMAKGPSWDYLSVAWNLSGKIEDGPFEEDMDGYQVAAVKGIGDTFFLAIRSDANSIDVGGVHIDVSTQQVSFGGRFPVSPDVDLWASLNYQRYVLFPAVGTGFGLDVGARWMVSNAFELGLTAKVSGDLDFEDYAPDADYTGYDLTAAFQLNPNVAITLSHSDHTLEFDVGGKLKFAGVSRLGVRLSY